MSQKFKIEDNIATVILLILIAYLFSVGMRMYWPIHFSDTLSMYYNNQLMINTNDGYFFASGAKDILNGIVPEDHARYSASVIGLAEVTATLAKLLPFSLDTIILYMPAVVSSLLVIPIILAARLMRHTLLGFFAALIGGIAWSYYNRTMVGYYDSDMFSIFFQFSIFYSFLYIAYKKNIYGLLLASSLILIYPYFYPQGISITYAMFGMLIVYLFLEYKGLIKTKETISFKDNYISFYGTVILIGISLMGMIPVWIRGVLLVIALFFIFTKNRKEKELLYLSIITFLAFLYFGDIVNVLLGKLMLYTNRGVEKEGLHFFQVIQTVREAGSIPMTTVANRISGSSIGLILSSIGYGFLVWRHKPFIVALPLIGVGLFAYIGGLRFTVYAVPVAAISVVYLFWVVGSLFKDKIVRYLFVVLATGAMLYPNITHIIRYKVPTVMNKTEVEDLTKLNNISDRKDYTLAWWDYGFPIWYYTDTSTLIDGGKHQNDNYIISKIMFSTSPQQVANLSRLAVETYVDSNYSNVANTLFHNGKKTQKNPNILMKALTKSDYPLPEKTREVYLYMPFRMLNIFPTVGVFGNLNLQTGKPMKQIVFYPTQAIKQNGTKILFKNGILFDSSNGTIKLGKNLQKVYRFDQVKFGVKGNSKVETSLMHLDGNFCVVNLQSYNKVIVMDKETYNSAYVQMFMLGKYDKNLFELVVSSPYSKIYRVKK